MCLTVSYAWKARQDRRGGPRVPAAGAVQTPFRIATILVTTAGPATPEEMSLSWLASRAEARTPKTIREAAICGAAAYFAIEEAMLGLSGFTPMLRVLGTTTRSRSSIGIAPTST